MKVWEEFLRISGWRSSYESVDRALRHYARKSRSENTKENFCFALMSFCRYCGLDPDSLAALEPGEASRLCQGFTDQLMEKGHSVRYINMLQAYLKAFFKENGFEGPRELKVERYYQPARYRKRPEYIPTPDEIYRMGYASGSAKNRAMIFMLYTSGLRNSTLRALSYGDVKRELEAGLEVVKIPVYPEMKRIDPAACKGNIPYYTFINKEATKALREYLENRKGLFGGISEEEPLFCSDSNKVSMDLQRRTPVSRIGLDRMVKRAAKNAGIAQWKDVTAHGLRKAFESALRNNRLDIKDQEFLMGHILPGSQDAYYDKTKVEELRAKYARVEFFPQPMGSEELRKRQILDMVRLLGFPEERVKKVEEALAKHKTVDEAMEEIRELGLNSFERREGKNSDPRKIVSEGELEGYLAEGWDVQAILPSGRILVRRILK